MRLIVGGRWTADWDGQEVTHRTELGERAVVDRVHSMSGTFRCPLGALDEEPCLVGLVLLGKRTIALTAIATLDRCDDEGNLVYRWTSDGRADPLVVEKGLAGSDCWIFLP